MLFRSRVAVSVSTATRRALKRLSAQVFLNGDRFGVHVLPKHYYSPVPDYRWLAENQSLWRRPVDMTGVDWDLDEQLRWLREACSQFAGEVRGLAVYRSAESGGFGLGYGPIESQVLHAVCRRTKPRRWIEVGSGVTTICTLYALRRNQEDGAPACEVTCIEPFPHAALRQLEGIRLIPAAVQSVTVEDFSRLEAGDVLFIDSTHAVKTGSDVTYLLLEILPRLQPGVLIHLHDIFLPFVCRPDILETYFDWQETSLLLALLKGNASLKVRCCLSALHDGRSGAVGEILPDYDPARHFPTKIGRAHV